MDNTIGNGRRASRNDDAEHDGQQLDAKGIAGELGNADNEGSQTCGRDELQGPGGADEGRGVEQSSRSPWSDLDWLPCSDGKARPTQSGLFPLAHGLPGRVGRLRAYGNAIVPQVAAEFIIAAREAMMPELGRHPLDSPQPSELGCP